MRTLFEVFYLFQVFCPDDTLAFNSKGFLNTKNVHPFAVIVIALTEDTAHTQLTYGLA